MPQVFSQNLNVGDVVDFYIDTEAGKYTFKCGGSADVIVGVYKTDKPVGTPDSSVKIEGIAAWGTRLMVAGKHLVRVVKVNSPGSFTFSVDKYSILDQIGLWFTHKSK